MEVKIEVDQPDSSTWLLPRIHSMRSGSEPTNFALSLNLSPRSTPTFAGSRSSMNGGSSAPIPSMYCDVTGALPALFVLVLVSASVLDAADDDVTFDAGCRFSTMKGNE